MADERIGPVTFPLYYDRWIGATRHLSAAARGVYLDWLGWTWCKRKPLPMSIDARCRIAAISPDEYNRLWPELAEFWRETPLGLVNDSLERKRTEHNDFYASQHEKAKKGAAARWKNHAPGNAPGMSPGNAPGNAPAMPSDLGSRSSDLDLDPRISDRAERSSRGAASNGSNGDWKEPHPNPHGSPNGLVNGHVNRKHAQHAWCAKDRPNLCIPYTFHEEIRGAMQKPDAEVYAWYASTIAKFAGKAIGDDRFVFWRNELAATVGTVTAPPPKGKPQESERAKRGREALQRARAEGRIR